jgi:hypothetical protein
MFTPGVMTRFHCVADRAVLERRLSARLELQSRKDKKLDLRIFEVQSRPDSLIAHTKTIAMTVCVQVPLAQAVEKQPFIDSVTNFR